MAGHRLTQILQTYLDLELHLLLDANHLFGAAHLPDTLIACLYHLGQGGHVRSACQVFPATMGDCYVQELTLTDQPHRFQFFLQHSPEPSGIPCGVWRMTRKPTFQTKRK